MSKAEKKLNLGIKITGLVFLLLTGFFIYIGYDVVDGMGPRVYTGEDARVMLKGFFGTSLPEGADKLYYRNEGFQDSFTNVGLSLPPKEAWPFIERYSKKKKSDFKKFTHPNPGFLPEETPLWDIDSMKAPLFVELKEKRVTRVVLYDDETERLLVYFASY